MQLHEEAGGEAEDVEDGGDVRIIRKDGDDEAGRPDVSDDDEDAGTGHEANPDDAEEIDGELEVDVVEGIPRLAKPGALRGEANTISRLLTHRFWNLFCQTCVRAKMKRRKTSERSFQPDAEEVRGPHYL